MYATAAAVPTVPSTKPIKGWARLTPWREAARHSMIPRTTPVRPIGRASGHTTIQKGQQNQHTTEAAPKTTASLALPPVTSSVRVTRWSKQLGGTARQSPRPLAHQPWSSASSQAI